MTQAKQVGLDIQSISKKTRSRRLSGSVQQKESRTVKQYRKQLKIGLHDKQLSYEAFFIFLENFAAEQWQKLPIHASQWERGQVDGLFWALDKLDELVIE